MMRAPPVGDLSMAQVQEMEPGERLVHGIYPATSSTARMILGFAGAIYSGARSAPQIPLAGTERVLYDQVELCYAVHLPQPCPLDGGALTLHVSVKGMVIRCAGPRCRTLGKRWDRPSHSSAMAGAWNLSFLFPSVEQAVQVVADFPDFAVSMEAVVEEPNFFRALGLDNYNVRSGHVVAARLLKLQDWIKLNKPVSEMALRLAHKVHVMSQIFLSKEALEACYRESLAVAPQFAYPVQLIPRGPSTLASALWMHLASKHGYKRVEDDFYVPTTDASGRTYYRTVPLQNLLTTVLHL